MAKNLLICGILSSLLYVLMNIFVPLFEGYNIPSHTVSELSAINPPSELYGCFLRLFTYCFLTHSD